MAYGQGKPYGDPSQVLEGLSPLGVRGSQEDEHQQHGDEDLHDESLGLGVVHCGRQRQPGAAQALYMKQHPSVKIAIRSDTRPDEVMAHRCTQATNAPATEPMSCAST